MITELNIAYIFEYLLHKYLQLEKVPSVDKSRADLPNWANYMP